jgi:Holliday junction DNA helicase RuvA
MYAYIRGRIVSRLLDALVIENQGIGYEIHAAPELLARFPAKGEETTVFTRLYVREDVQVLYGFPDAEDKNLFDLLLLVSGIGPKVASTIIGTLTPGQFALAVMTGDIRTLTKIRGIGRKGAERLILELKDKMKGVEMPEIQAAGNLAVPAGCPNQAEAVSALMVLGYSGPESSRAVTAAYTEDIGLEDLIRLALRQLMR